MQEMNLLPTPESPVTRQEKMATVWDEAEQDGIGEEVLKMSTEEIVQRTRLLDSEIKIMKSEVLRVTHELQAMKDKIKENSEKIKVNKTLPYLVSNVIELLDVDPNDQEEDGANIDLDSQRKGKCAVIKTSTRQVRLAQSQPGRRAAWGSFSVATTACNSSYRRTSCQ